MLDLSKPATVRNRLLKSLPSDVLAALQPKLNSVILKQRQTLYTPDEVIDAVYFPESSVLSLVANLEDGTQAEVGIIGREGVLGTSLLSGIQTSYIEAMVQIPGSALRMNVRDWQEVMKNDQSFRRLIFRSNEALQTQIMQTAACNGHHSLEQRVARWLLMAHDRADGAELPVTQDLMAMMLGVHRPSITIIASSLQRAGSIRYSGGRITVVNRAKLEGASCECYSSIKKRFEILFDKKF